MKKLLLVGFLSILSSMVNIASAQNVVVTETKEWRSVPINVNTSGNTYTLMGTVPADTTNYYYSYSGYRCFRERRSFAGIDAVIFRAGVSGGYDIYCYPEN